MVLLKFLMILFVPTESEDDDKQLSSETEQTSQKQSSDSADYTEESETTGWSYSTSNLSYLLAS